MKQQRGTGRGTRYGSRFREGIEPYDTRYARSPVNSLATLAPGPTGPTGPSVSPGTEMAPSYSPEPEPMSPYGWEAFKTGMVGGYPSRLTATRTPTAYRAFELGVPAQTVAMRTVAPPINIVSSLYGGLNALAAYNEMAKRAGTYTTVKQEPVPGVLGKLGFKEHSLREPAVVNPHEPVRRNRLRSWLAARLGLDQPMADYLAADPESDYGGFGGVGPNVDLSSTDYGRAAQATYGTPQAWGGDIDVSTDAPGTAGPTAQDFGWGGGDGGGIGGGGLGGGLGGEGDVGSGETGAGLGPGHGGDADAEGFW